MIQSRPARTSPKASRKPKPGRSRQEVRTAATQRRLLAAAETVFARDGFEAARLEDIAAIAGYTRGAFYAHFQSKEDIFVGLLEQWVAERIAEVSALLEKQKSPQARLRALRDHYTHSRKDRRLVLLSLEFKLFAIRHPEAHARLRARHQRLRACAGDFVARVAKALGRPLPIPSTAAATGLGALSNALVLEHLFDQVAITDHDIRHILGALFDAILGTATHQQ
ncbi:MAG TPA: TetR/AcrR family transcriptional regulator [Candidatus Baltobacteraceae bacterium]|nr:TetR/AcrR family transcriptional regulator [Candidatus Baltobacteraceae bacterium]